jgi:mono/diheme cytochrome c family protein
MSSRNFLRGLCPRAHRSKFGMGPHPRGPSGAGLPPAGMRTRGPFALLLLSMPALGCRNEMYDQAKAKPLSESTFFANGQNARPLPPHTVARGFLREDKAMYAGIAPSGSFVTELPLPLTRKLLERGQQRFDIFCSPCHGKQGNGLGMIVQRGFKQPSSFHVERLRQQPVGYFFDVMTQGFGQMPSYASQVTPEDRWAIAAYMRALQLSQHAVSAELSPDDRKKLAQTAIPRGHRPPSGETK